MTTLQEAAMRNALEALETCSYGDYSAKHVVDPSFDGDAVEAAIESLKAALAQQGEQAKPAAYITDTEQGLMVWTPEMYGEACTYCDDGEFPIPLYTATLRPTSGDYAQGYAEGFNDACKPAPQAQDKSDNYLSGYCTGRTDLLKEQAAPQPAQELTGCACRWDADDKRIATCVRHQGWLDVVHEWVDRAKAAEAALRSAQPVAQPLAKTCDTCAHYQQGKHPGVSIHDETCYECRSYWGNKWEAA